MNKIPTIFERDWEGDRSRVLDLPNQSADVQWVFDGEGSATRKYDGTCVMFDGSDWWARREVKAGKAAPAGYVPLEHDHVTGKEIGWEPIAQSPFVKFFLEAIALDDFWPEGTYELVGPKIQGNPEDYGVHGLVPHTLCEEIGNLDRSYDGIRAFLAEAGWEGIVFHHVDGRMAKIKGRDFGIRRQNRSLREER